MKKETKNIKNWIKKELGLNAYKIEYHFSDYYNHYIVEFTTFIEQFGRKHYYRDLTRIEIEEWNKYIK